MMPDNSVFLVLPGLCMDAVLLQAVHLVIPMDIRAHAIVWVSIAALLYATKTKPIPFGIQLWDVLMKNKWAVLTALAAALLNLAGRAGTGDIADYHLQAIAWDEQFAVVKGLGNLRRQLGNNSNWFLLHAFFGLHFLGLKSVYILNAMLLIVALVYFAPRRDEPLYNLKSVVLMYVALMAYRKYVGAVTNDYAITLFILMVFTEWLDFRKGNISRLPLIVVLMMLPTIKLSAITLLLIPAIWLWLQFKGHHYKRIWAVLLAGVVIYVPWLTTNVMHSGYLIYPLDQIDLFKVDWKMHASTLQYERAINIAHERVPGVAPELVRAMPFGEWFTHWLNHLDRFSLFLLVSFSAGVVWLCMGFLHERRRQVLKERMLSGEAWILLGSVALAMPVWFMNAPATRFVFGYLVFFMAWMSLHLFQNSGTFWFRMKPVIYVVVWGSLVLQGVLFMRQYLPAEKFGSSLLMLQPYRTQANQKVDLAGGGYIMMPLSDQQCWDTEIPCTSILDPGLEWRGSSLAEGFRIKNSTN